VNILLLHNSYLQAGGEDVVYANESKLLERHGHRVTRFSVHNDQVAAMPRVKLAAKTLWNRSACREIAGIIRANRIQVCHFHNTFPLISPAAYYAARDEGVPVVQTLHNFRLICPKAVLFRDGRVCEDCVHAPFAWPSVLHRCYRGDRAATAVTALMLATHRVVGTWQNRIGVYIALSRYCRDKFVEAGLPADQIVVKPNFLMDDPGAGPGDGAYALFVGRLAEEKGVRTLLQAWKALPSSIPLKIAGDGPLSGEVAAASQQSPHIEHLGRVPSARVTALMQKATALIFASEWFEAGPMTIVEALACGTPVIASNLGSAGEVVADGRTGFHFLAGDPHSLAETVRSRWAALGDLRRAARQQFEAEHTPQQNYRRLMSAYALAGAQAAEACDPEWGVAQC
jgi:glycosyltransferase involved in cell wall biosynthesis